MDGSNSREGRWKEENKTNTRTPNEIEVSCTPQYMNKYQALETEDYQSAYLNK